MQCSIHRTDVMQLLARHANRIYLRSTPCDIESQVDRVGTGTNEYGAANITMEEVFEILLIFAKI